MRNILFLEDDKLLAMSVLDELREASYEVDWVQEGDEAAEACFAKKYSLYLFDVNVPGINGFELLEQLRRSGDVTPRITSYNVCYTKLLRNSLKIKKSYWKHLN